MYEKLINNLNSVIKRELEKPVHFTGELRVDWMAQDCLNAIESLTRQLAEVTAERDAAVEDLKTLEHATGYCLVCKYSSHGDCHYPNNKCGWQWRGVKGDAE